MNHDRNTKSTRRGFIFGAVIGLGSLSALAWTLPHTFTPGSPIRAAEVNANFEDLKNRALILGDDRTINAATPALKLKNSSVAVYAESSGSSGVQGEATGTGSGVLGHNSSSGNSGRMGAADAGVYAFGAQTALMVDGPIRVSGSKAAFVHTATAANTLGFVTCFDSQGNGDPEAMVTVTVRGAGPGSLRNNHPIGVEYSGSQWCIKNQDLGAIPVGTQFNVLVIKQ